MMVSFFRQQRIILGIACLLCLAFIASFAQQRTAFAAAAPTPIPTPPSEPANPTFVPTIPVGISGATSATGGGISADDIRRYVTTHNVPGNMGSSQFTILSMNDLTLADLIPQLNGMDPGLPQESMVWFVQLQGQFAFPGSSEQPDGLHFTTAFEVFIANTGNLLMEGGLPSPTSGATPTPPTSTATPAGVPTATATAAGGATPTPAPTTTPIPPPHLTATMPTEKCANANWLNPIVLKNVGGQSLHWTGSVPALHTLTPNSGTLLPGQSVSVKIGPQFMNPYNGATFPVNFVSNGGNIALKLPCNG
jgi:hypothetical protein